MLDRRPELIHQDTRALPAIKQVQRRGWCPTTITTSVGLAGQTAGGQIHLPIMRYTINSEPPTSTDQTLEAPRESPGFGAPGGALLRGALDLDQENTVTKHKKTHGGCTVGRYFLSTDNVTVFNVLWPKLAERVGFEPTKGY